MQSLGAQTLAVIFAVMLVSHLVGVTIYALDRRDAVATTETFDLAERIVGVFNLVMQLPEDRRADLLRLADSRSLRVFISTSASRLSPPSDDELAAEVHQFLLKELQGWTADRVVVDLSPATAAEPSLHVALQLSDGQWLRFAGALPTASPEWPGTAGAYVIIMAIGFGAVAIWLVRRVTAPLSIFASAADRLGKNMRAEPLPESGPKEVVQAARAFNGMQKRLQRLVEHRTRMLAAISHDLRTPVSLMRLRSELVSEPEQRAKLLQSVDDMEAMISSTLEFSRETSRDEATRQIDLSALVESICDDLTDTGMRCSFETPGPRVLSARPTAMKRALTNVIENAVKYGHSAHVRLNDNGRSQIITVDDEGPGVAPDELENIFQPFYRIDQSRSRDNGGTGLGLSIAQSIIHQHGGTIDAENLSQRGLRVTVTLPK
jgi:signal transduction histidine kinase